MTSYPAPPKIERYPLPPMPPPEVVNSRNHNEVHYDPNFWNLEYVPRRWLERVDDTELVIRYRHMIRNRRTFVGPHRDAMPIWWHESSWYWLRRDYITRLEFAMRDLALPVVPEIEPPQGSPPQVPHSDVLYRFGQREHMLELAHGRVRFTPAKSYQSIEDDEARQDEETAKHAYSAGQQVRIITGGEQEIPIIGNMKTTVSGHGYHMACFTKEWDAQFLQAFGDTCIVVHEIDEFARRLEEAGRSVFPGWYWVHTNADYFDPYERYPGFKLMTATSKDFLFAYQREYRFFWDRLDAAHVEGVQYVDIGPCTDILSVYDRKGNPL